MRSRAVGCCVCGGGVYLFIVTFFFARMQCTYAVVHCYSVVGQNTHGWGAGVPCLIAELRVYLRLGLEGERPCGIFVACSAVKGGRGRQSDISFFMCAHISLCDGAGEVYCFYMQISCQHMGDFHSQNLFTPLTDKSFSLPLFQYT